MKSWTRIPAKTAEINKANSIRNRYKTSSSAVQQAGLRSRLIQRKLVVEDHNKDLQGTPKKKNWEEIKDFIKVLSSSFEVKNSGVIKPKLNNFCKKIPGRITDVCLCDLHKSTVKDPWKVKIDDIAWPHTESGNRRVTIHSTRSPVSFGSWGKGPSAHRVVLDRPRTLAHELCGHAWLHERKVHPSASYVWKGKRLIGRTHHDAAITVTNIIAKEIGSTGVRGTYGDPHHGESFALVTVSGFPSGKHKVSLLSTKMKKRLEMVEKAMKQKKYKRRNGKIVRVRLKADIIGHADHPGPAWANASISRQRAYSVRNWLMGKKILYSQFKAVKGKSNKECPSVPAVNPYCRKADIYMFVYEAASEAYP